MGGPQARLEAAAGTGGRALMGQGYGTRFDLIMPIRASLFCFLS